MTIEWPKHDADKIFAAMSAGCKYLNWDSSKALAQAIKSIVQSLKKATKVAPKYRDVVEVSANEWGHRDEAHSEKYFDITGWLGKPRKLKTIGIRAYNISDAKRNRIARISASGLAKRTWPTLGGMAGKWSSLEIKNIGDDQGVKIRNWLPYIVEAIDGGERTIETIKDKAAASMMHSIEKQLVKRMGLGSLSR